MAPIVIQLGHSRDGGRYFHAGAAQLGATVALVETHGGRASFTWGEAIGEPAFEEVRWAEPVLHDIVAAAVSLAAGRQVLAVVPGFELFTVAAQQAGERLRLPLTVAPAVIERLRRKDRQRLWLADRLPASAQPAFAICGTEAEALAAAARIGYPVVVKPVDSGGSSGVRLAADEDGVLEATKPILAGQTLDHGVPGARVVLVEEFVDGAEHGVQGVVDLDGSVRALAVSTKALRTDGGGFLERRHLLAPPGDHPAVAAFVGDVIGALGLTSSAFHADIRMRGEAPVLVEAGARLSGAYIPRALRLAGVDWGAAALAVGTGARATKVAPLGAAAAIELLTPEVLPRVLRMGPGSATTELVLDLGRLADGGGYQDFHDRVGARVVVGAHTLEQW